jgi:hypothetical protein
MGGATGISGGSRHRMRQRKAPASRPGQRPPPPPAAFHSVAPSARHRRARVAASAHHRARRVIASPRSLRRARRDTPRPPGFSLPACRVRARGKASRAVRCRSKRPPSPSPTARRPRRCLEVFMSLVSVKCGSFHRRRA